MFPLDLIIAHISSFQDLCNETSSVPANKRSGPWCGGFALRFSPRHRFTGQKYHVIGHAPLCPTFPFSASASQLRFQRTDRGINPRWQLMVSDDRWLSRLFELCLILNGLQIGPGGDNTPEIGPNNLRDLTASPVFQITAIIGNDTSAAITHAALTRKMGESHHKVPLLSAWRLQLHGVRSSNELDPRGWKLQRLSVTPR